MYQYGWLSTMSFQVKLNPINLYMKGDCDGISAYVTYSPHDQTIMHKLVDGDDVWYTFIRVLHIPEIKMVLFLSLQRYSDYGDANTSTMTDEDGQLIRLAMRLPDGYTVTDSRDMFRKRRAEYIEGYRQRMKANPRIIYELYPQDMIEALQDTMPNTDVAERIMSHHMLPNIAWFTYDWDAQASQDTTYSDKGNSTVRYWEGLFYCVPIKRRTYDLEVLVDTTYVAVVCSAATEYV